MTGSGGRCLSRGTVAVVVPARAGRCGAFFTTNDCCRRRLKGRGRHARAGRRLRDAGTAVVDLRLAAIGLSALLDGLWLEWCLEPGTFRPAEAVELCEAWIASLSRSAPQAGRGDPRARARSSAAAPGAAIATELSAAMILEKALTLELQHFEDSEFYDKLTRARREASTRPLSLVTRTFGLVQNGVSLASYGVLLAHFSPWAVAVLLLAGLPAFVAEAKFSGDAFRLFRWRSPETRMRLTMLAK